MSHSALLVIDVQQSFEHMPFWEEKGLAEYQQCQNALIAHARAKGWPVVFVYHVSRGHFAMQSGLVEPMDWVDRRMDDPVFYKHIHSALGESGLEPWLAARGITHLVISGIRTEQCCETTARVGRDTGYEVDYVIDATLTFAMQAADGNTVSADAIKSHTALVLEGRFAAVSGLRDFVDREQLSTLNQFCPRSNKPVCADSLCDYRGHVVGFCYPSCRDSFAREAAANPFDCLYFDRLLARQAVNRAYL